MSVRRYGIYLAYPPTMDLRGQGLGRHLASFLKGTVQRKDVNFVIVCPSWTKQSLGELFEQENVPETCVSVITPRKSPVALRLYQKWLAYQQWKRKPRARYHFRKKLDDIKNAYIKHLLQQLTSTDSIYSLLLRLLPVVCLGVLAILLIPLWLILKVLLSVVRVGKRCYLWGKRKCHSAQQRLLTMLGDPKNDPAVVRIYRMMEKYEANRMHEIIHKMDDVHCWYCPTSFWPSFNQISAPRLLCVPDAVPVEFPVGFAQMSGGNRTLEQFQYIEKTIRSGTNYVTYSNNVKWSTLVNRYLINPDRISVIHHAVNSLNGQINIKGTPDDQAATTTFSRNLFINAIQRSNNGEYVHHFENDQLQFFFYASQFRPNKNIITLLRAYKYLLRKRFVGHKLILTGVPETMPQIYQFVTDHHLAKDVLFLHGLTVQELAACYKLADLAVNPSLSEGGCPFTFTEALSVDTPAVLARIPVTEEILTDPKLQEMTFFDPYDWRDMAHRIEWAVNNRKELLETQRKTYAELSKRTWTDVVNEYLDVMDDIGNKFQKKSQSRQ